MRGRGYAASCFGVFMFVHHSLVTLNPMPRITPAFVLLALTTALCPAQQPQPTLADPAAADETVRGLLDIEFKLAPVELDISEELTKAKLHYEAGEWQQAVEAASQFLDENPGHEQTAAGLFLRGEALVQLQRYDDVRRDFQQLVRRSPNLAQRSRAEFRIAEATMLSGDFTEAQRLFEAFRTRHPNDELNAYVIAYLAETIGRKNPPWAKALYVESIQRYPAGPLNRRARLHLALIRFGEGHHQIARGDLQKLVETGDQSTNEYWTAWYWLGRAEAKAGETAAAIDRFLSFTEQLPQHEFAAAALFQAGEAYRKTGETKKALDLYRRVRSDWPGSSYSSASLVGEMQLLKKTRQLDEALTKFGELPSETSAAIKQQATQLATEILIAKKEYEQAEALIRPLTDPPRSLQRNSDRNGYYTNLYLLALAQRGQGRFRSANELLGRVRQELVSDDLAQRVVLARIETWVASKDYNEATQAALRFESRFPDSALLPAVRNQMVRSLVQQKRFVEANVKFQQLKNTSDAASYTARAAEVVAEAAYARGDYDTARDAFETLENSDPSDEALARAVSGLAWIDRKQGKHADAIRRFASFISAFPKHSSVWEIRLAYADTLAESNRMDEAMRVLASFANLPAAHPLRPRGLLQLADLAKSDPQQSRRAAEIVDSLLADYPDFEQRDATLYLAGMIQRGVGSPEASKHFAELVEKYPSSQHWSDALYRLAELAHAKRDGENAKRYLTRLISAERDKTVLPHALFMRGRIESDAKQWSQARETLRELLREYPESKLVDVARYGVAESFFQEKEFDRAYQLFQILDHEERFEPDDTWGAMVQLRTAQLEVHRKDLVRAAAIAEQIESKYPAFSLQHEVDYLIGRVAAARGEFSKARNAYQKVVAADSTYQKEITAMSQWMIGESYFHQKNYILAIKAYEALIPDLRFANWQAASHLQVGKCYELMDNLEQARVSYERVVKRFGDSKWADEAEYRLESVNESS